MLHIVEVLDSYRGAVHNNEGLVQASCLPLHWLPTFRIQGLNVENFIQELTGPEDEAPKPQKLYTNPYDVISQKTCILIDTAVTFSDFFFFDM